MRQGFSNIGGTISLILAGIFVILLAFFFPATSVAPGKVGVPIMFGKVQDYTLPSGFHFINPLLDVVEIPVNIQRVPVATAAGSSDLQTVTIKATANYRVNTKSVSKLYFDFQKRYEEELIIPSVLEAIKSASAKLTAEKLIVERQNFRQSVIGIANEKLTKYGILLEEVSIENIDFSEEFNKAIEQKVTAEQQALTSKNQLEKVKYEAQQTIEKAKAEAEAIRIQAEAIQNQGGAEYVKLKAVEQWNGVMPTYMMDGAMPLINLK
jgi:prohibitin 2